MPRSYHILFVDDDKDTCDMMSFLLTLTNSDYQVISAKSAAEALALIEDRSFDMYILDYLLPDLTGVELCSRIRQRDKRTPIMFYSGMTHIIDLESAKAAGANDFLVKPNDLDRFTDTVSEYLNHR
jgi:CheY-like chemotaxis protein